MLTERQQLILKLVIQLYTSDGLPVGSKTLMNAGVKASSATIRNDLAALEQKGYLEKTHTSSGRIPSVQGYRFYVDHLLQPRSMTPAEVSRIKTSFRKDFREINDIIQQSAKILSGLTSYTAFSLGPEINERRLTGFRIVPLNNQQLMAIIVTDKGNVESQIFTIPPSISSSDIEQIVRIINDKLIGEPLITVYHKLRTEIPLILQRYFQSPGSVMDIFEMALSQAFEEKVYVSGKMNLLDFDLFSDVPSFKSIYSLMDNHDEVVSLIEVPDDGIEIKIGNELEKDELARMSLMTASYQVPGHGKGTIAILGPTNMSYAKMFGLMDVFRHELANHLTDYYRLIDSFSTS